MIWWLVGGLVLFAVVLLGLVCAPVLRRLRTLRGATARLQQRVEAAQGLQASVEELAERAAGLEASLARTAGQRRPKV